MLLVLFSRTGLVMAISSSDANSIYSDTVWYDPSSGPAGDNSCSLTGGGSSSSPGAISSDVGKGMSQTAQEKFQQILVAAGSKFNVDPNFLASFYFEENNTNQVDLLKQGAANWREPPPPYGNGAPWNQSKSGDGYKWPDGTIGARGPFQFEPGTWSGDKQDGNGDGVEDPLDLADAAFAAAYKLSTQGGKIGSSIASLRQAALAYNNVSWYADAILEIYNFLSGGGQSSVSGSAGCQGAGSGDISVYQNPFRDVGNISPMRIDEGVDYGGDGPVYAIGKGTISYSKEVTGWPGVNGPKTGSAISYLLSDGPATGKTIYVAENCTLNVALNIGSQVDSNTVLCTMHSTYPFIETGWAKPDSDVPISSDEYQRVPNGSAMDCGYNFSNLLSKLGAPPGAYQFPSQQNNPVGSACSSWPTW